MHRFATLLAFAVLVASAQDFQWGAVSPPALGRGGIFIPSGNQVLDSLSVNPAGLAALNGRTVDVSLSTAMPFGSFSNSANPRARLDTGAQALPAAAFGAPLSASRWSAGAGIIPVLASKGDWLYNDAAGAAGVSYGLQPHRSTIIAMRAAFGVGLRVSRKLDLGASYGVLYNANRLQAPYIFQQHPVLSNLKTLLDLKTTGYGQNWSVGFWYAANSRVRFGAAYKSRSVIESTGTAVGSLSALFQALGVAAAPEFRYDAMVRNVLPQSVTATATVRFGPRWNLAMGGDWVNWKRAFRTLPVQLTNGTNSTVNQLVNATSIRDGVPLDWKDRFAGRLGLDYALTENATLRTGLVLGSGTVPASTLNPLTAAIWRHQISAGFSHRFGRLSLDAAYVLNLPSEASIANSAIRAGEYNNSRVRIGMHTFTVGSSYRF